MDISATQAAAVFALLDAIKDKAADDTQDYNGIRRLVDAAKAIMTELPVK